MSEPAKFDEFSWAVGLFEGEGSISFSRNSAGHYYPRISIAMCDEDIVQRFAEVFPGGGFSWEKGTNWIIHRYMIQNRDGIEAFLIQIQPYLSLKKSAECARALKLIDASRTRAPKAPVRRRMTMLTPAEIVQMRRDRAAGTPVANIAEKYLIGKFPRQSADKGLCHPGAGSKLVGPERLRAPVDDCVGGRDARSASDRMRRCIS